MAVFSFPYYHNFLNKGAPSFQNIKDEFKSFPMVYLVIWHAYISTKYGLSLYRWKAIELCFSNRGKPKLSVEYAFIEEFTVSSTDSDQF